MPSQQSRSHIEAQRRLRATLTVVAETLWRGLGSYDEKDTPRWLEQIVPVAAAGQRTSVALTDAYVAQVMGREPLGIEDVVIRNGAPMEEVYARPLKTVWMGLANGLPWQEAVDGGMARATSTIATDAQLAMRETVREIGTVDQGIFGWERVPDPGACKLCLIASTQRYHKADLLPIHDHCGCSVAPITDPTVGHVINKERYTELKKAGEIDKITAQRRGPRAAQRAQANRERAEQARREMRVETDPARKQRLGDRVERWESRAKAQDAIAEGSQAAVAQHGELGPVLVDPEHAFTSL